MELKFTGRGAMLFPEEGNTSAYFEDDNNFFLIDCGEDVASKLIKMGRLNQDKEYYLLITHTHSDHIGSLGTLQQYLYWCCNKKLNIVVSKNMGYLKEIKDIIRAFGLVKGTYNIVDIRKLDNKSNMFNNIEYIESSHGDVPIKSCSIIINNKNGSILYTGDIACVDVIDMFIRNYKIDKIYVDTSLKKSPVHLGIEELCNIIPSNIRNKVYCMHINNRELINIIEKEGFNLVKVEES